MRTFEEEIQKHGLYVFERNTSWQKYDIPSYTFDKKNGYAVFFIVNTESIDLGFYDKSKKLISFFSDINSKVKLNYWENFISECAIDD